jgi:hypothetical protein
MYGGESYVAGLLLAAAAFAAQSSHDLALADEVIE